MARVLVSAGPTREHLDEVRFLSNASSGRMGFAIAAAARALGHEVELVSGPTELPDPKGVAVTRVTSALEMDRAIRRAFPRCDVLIMAAAVADHRPARMRRGKTPKRELSKSLPLVANPDIVAGVARRKGGRVVVGFAAEVQDPLARGREKLARKRLDLIVVNQASVAGLERTSAVVLGPEGEVFRVRAVQKAELARRLVRTALGLLAAGREAPAPQRKTETQPKTPAPKRTRTSEAAT